MFKKPQNPTRNRISSRGDRLEIAIPIDETSGYQLRNIGISFGTNPTEWNFLFANYNSFLDTGVESAFKTEEEGCCIDLSDPDLVQRVFHSTGSNVVYLKTPVTNNKTINRGSCMIRFNVPSVVPSGNYTALRTILDTGVIENEHGRLFVYCEDGYLFVRLFSADTSVASLVSFKIDYDVNHTLSINWGEKGLKVWFNGTLAIHEQRYSSTEPLKINSNGINISATEGGVSLGYIKLYTFALWSFPLHEIEIEELMTDPYLMLRPRPALFSTDVNPQVGRVKTDIAIFNVVTSSSVSHKNPVYFRVAYHNDKLLSEYNYSNISFCDTPLSKIELEIQVPSGVYYYVAQYSNNGEDWEVFPGGRGKFVTQKISGEFCFSIFSDDHIGNPLMNIDNNVDKNDDYIGNDIVINNGTPKVYSAWMGAHDIFKDIHKNDFIVHVGDGRMGDRALDQDSQNTVNKVWRNFFNPVLKTGCFYAVNGNHEGEPGYLQNHETGVNVPMQLISTVSRKKYLSLPTGSTYPEGGEGGKFESSTDWIPTGSSLMFDFDSNEYKNEYINNPTLDPNNYNSSPLENFYAFTHSNCLFVFLDIYRYTEPGDPDMYGGIGGFHHRSGPNWILGAVQKSWLQQVLSTSQAQWKCVFIHNLPGEQLSPNGDLFYGRGSGVNINPATSSPEEIEMHNLFKQYGVTAVFKGHDHKFAHVNYDNVNYVNCPALSAPSLFSDGWNWESANNSFGSAAELGADKKGVLKHFNVLGYVKVFVSDSEFKITLRETEIVMNNDLVTLKYAHSRFLSEKKHSVRTNSAIVDEIPVRVAMAVLDTEVSVPEWWNQNLNQLYTSPFESPTEENHGSRTIQLNANVPNSKVLISYVPRNLYSANL